MLLRSPTSRSMVEPAGSILGRRLVWMPYSAPKGANGIGIDLFRRKPIAQCHYRTLKGGYPPIPVETARGRWEGVNHPL